LVVDSSPGYLRLPRGLRKRKLSAAESSLLCDGARRAIAARESGDRCYLRRFEEAMFEAVGGVRPAAESGAAPRVSKRRSARRGTDSSPGDVLVAWIERVRRLVRGGLA
jgi:hypothetical protein